MALTTNQKIGIGVGITIAVIVIIVVAVKYLTPAPVVVPGQAPNKQLGILDQLKSIDWKKVGDIFKPKKEDPCINVICSTTRTGWDADGFPNVCCE